MKTLLRLAMMVCLTCLYTMPAEAKNPIICDRYTPDPAPYVHGDTLYLFVDHDENETLNNYFTMKDCNRPVSPFDNSSDNGQTVEWFDLQGRPRKGSQHRHSIQIINGKKVVIK